MLYKIGGKVRHLCGKCEHSEQMRLKAWLMKDGLNKEARTMRQDKPFKAIILVTDPKDYAGKLNETADAVAGSIIADRTALANLKEKV